MAVQSFLFDLGNSASGPLGLCARVKAPTRELALARLRRALPEVVEVEVATEGQPNIEYVSIYLNADHIRDQDITESETQDCEGAEYTAEELPALGYRIDYGTPGDGDLAGRYWFTAMRPGWGEVEVGDGTWDTEAEAWAEACEHAANDPDLQEADGE